MRFLLVAATLALFVFVIASLTALLPATGADTGQYASTAAAVISGIATVVLATIALVALRFAADQAQAAKQSNQQVARNAQAQTLLEIYRRWNSDDMKQKHMAVVGLIRKLSTGQAELASYLDEARRMRLEEYVNILEFFNFFETVALLVERKYVALEDVYELLDSTAQRYWSQLGKALATHLRAQLTDEEIFDEYEKLVARFDEVEAAKKARKAASGSGASHA